MDTVISSIVPLLIVGLIALIVGILIGLLIPSLFNENNQKGRKIPKDLQELIILFRDRKNFQIVIGVRRNYFRSIDDLPIKTVRILEQFNSEFNDWLNIRKQGRKYIEPEKLSQVISSNKWEKEPEIIDDQESYHSIIQTSSSQSIPSQVREDQKNLEPDGDARKSIAVQIDQIIQEKIVDSIFFERRIRLMENPVGGVEVMVDGKKFEGVNEIDEESIRDFIKECVSEWEKKAGSF